MRFLLDWSRFTCGVVDPGCPREGGSGRVLAGFGRSLRGCPVQGRYARRAGGTSGDTGSGLPDQRLRLRGDSGLPRDSPVRAPSAPGRCGTGWGGAAG